MCRWEKYSSLGEKCNLKCSKSRKYEAHKSQVFSKLKEINIQDAFISAYVKWYLFKFFDSTVS